MAAYLLNGWYNFHKIPSLQSRSLKKIYDLIGQPSYTETLKYTHPIECVLALDFHFCLLKVTDLIAFELKVIFDPE